MKISDSGPSHMRVDPHILTDARNGLIERKAVLRHKQIWYHRFNADPKLLAPRLAELEELHNRTTDKGFALRLGQTLEIAIQKALERGKLEFVGAFLDLEEHDDGTLYKKEEPPLRFSGARMPGDKRFDFLAFHPKFGRFGIEAKNVREWIYPRRDEIKELIAKSLTADAVPVLIARRVPYVTIRLMTACGMMIFQNFNQLYPNADADLAAAVRDKNALGYHDVRAGNDPNKYLVDFLTNTISNEAEDYRDRFERHKDLLSEFCSGEMSYASFAARVRRRGQGISEDSDDAPEETNLNPDDMTPD